MKFNKQVTILVIYSIVVTGLYMTSFEKSAEKSEVKTKTVQVRSTADAKSMKELEVKVQTLIDSINKSQKTWNRSKYIYVTRPDGSTETRIDNDVGSESSETRVVKSIDTVYVSKSVDSSHTGQISLIEEKSVIKSNPSSRKFYVSGSVETDQSLKVDPRLSSGIEVRLLGPISSYVDAGTSVYDYKDFRINLGLKLLINF